MQDILRRPKRRLLRIFRAKNLAGQLRELSRFTAVRIELNQPGQIWIGMWRVKLLVTWPLSVMDSIIRWI